jgi:hypothetical protein
VIPAGPMTNPCEGSHGGDGRIMIAIVMVMMLVMIVMVMVVMSS